MEETTTRAKADGVDVRAWGEFTDRPMAVLASLLSDLGLAGARIGIELDYLPASAFRELTASLAKATFDPVDEMLARLRQIKTPTEVEHMRRLSRIADRAIRDALLQATVGSTEMDIAATSNPEHFRAGRRELQTLDRRNR